MKKYGLSVAPLQSATRILASEISKLSELKRVQNIPSETQRVIDFGLSAFMPFVTLLAFRTEIAIKAGLEGSGLAVPRTHNIQELFQCLPEDKRQKISSQVSSPDFDQSLNQIANAFVDWRYFFEKSGDLSVDTKFLEELCGSLEVILSEEIRKSGAG